MNKILLFYPSFHGPNGSKTLYTDIPLSIVSLAASLHGRHSVRVIDERIEEPCCLEEALDGVAMVGISATTSVQIANGLKFAQKVRAYDPHILIVWGGWHPSLMPEDTVRNPFVDVVIQGQGEAVLCSLADCSANRDAWKSIPNLLYKTSDGEIVKTEERPHLEAMPPSMIPGYRYVNMDRYVHAGWGNQRLLGYESSRGCTYSCAFCSISSVYQKRWFALPPECVVNDLAFLKTTHRLDAVHMFDNNFFVDEKRALAIARLLDEKNIRLRWDGTVVTRQFLRFGLKEIETYQRSGFYRAIIGAESGDDEVLRKIKKRHTNREILELVTRCKENGILPTLSFMIGFPWNPEKDAENTIRTIEQVRRIDSRAEILLFVFSPYLGTPLYDIARAYGMEFPDDMEGWSKFTYDQPQTPWISDALWRKMNRYLAFFGTKEQSSGEKAFFREFRSELSDARDKAERI